MAFGAAAFGAELIGRGVDAGEAQGAGDGGGEASHPIAEAARGAARDQLPELLGRDLDHINAGREARAKLASHARGGAREQAREGGAAQWDHTQLME